MERRAKKSDCRATTRERTNTSLFFPRRRRLAAVYRKNPIRRLLLFPRVTLRIAPPPLPLLVLRALTSQGNITTISIPADIAGR